MENTHEGRVGALEVTINLFSFILMWVALFATGSLFFDVINHFYPDPLATNYDSNNLAALGSSITYAIASLVISLPLYVIAIRFWLKKFSISHTIKEGKLSRFLTYVILLAVALTIVGDLISLLFNFLQGEFGMRFVLKSLVILVLAVHTATFYYFERSFVQFKKAARNDIFKIAFAGSVIIAIIAIALGFMVSGSPMTQRLLRIDATRVQDMEQISSTISSYVWDTGRLPATLDDLARNSRYSYVRVADPETQSAYEYRTGVTADKPLSYELCATFAKAVTVTNGKYSTPISKWSSHPEGRFCVTEEATQSPDTVKALQVK